MATYMETLVYRPLNDGFLGVWVLGHQRFAQASVRMHVMRAYLQHMRAFMESYMQKSLL